MEALEKEKNKEREIIILVKEQSSVELGKMMKKFKDSLPYLMEIFFKELFNIISDTKEHINIKMETYIMDNGAMI